MSKSFDFLQWLLKSVLIFGIGLSLTLPSPRIVLATPPSQKTTGLPQISPRIPRLEIEAPDETSPGRLVVLDASMIPAKATSWVVLNPPLDDNHQIVDGGKRLIFATGQEGTYWFVFAFVPSEESDQITVIQIVHVLKVEGAVPPPGPSPPGPEPPQPVPPQPQPDFPDGRFGLAKLAFQIANEVIKDKSSCEAAAGVYSAIASKISAGALKNPDQIMTETVKLMKTKVGSSWNQWQDFGKRIAVPLEEFSKQGKIKSAKDLADAWSEIAIGLGKVK